MGQHVSPWFFGQLLNRASRQWRRAVDQALMARGASQATALPLLIMARGPTVGARQGLIAEELGLEGSSLVRVMEQLVTDGLVERREDPADRRAKLSSLTPEGWLRARDLEARLDALRERLLADVSAAEVDATVQILSRIEFSLAKPSPR